jgi:hypothetical protein
MPLKGFGSFKLPKKVASRASFSENTEFIVNTEWEMAGSAGPLKPYMTKWDFLQDRDLPIPGQQPYDYMSNVLSGSFPSYGIFANALGSCWEISGRACQAHGC